MSADLHNAATGDIIARRESRVQGITGVQHIPLSLAVDWAFSLVVMSRQCRRWRRCRHQSDCRKHQCVLKQRWRAGAPDRRCIDLRATVSSSHVSQAPDLSSITPREWLWEDGGRRRSHCKGIRDHTNDPAGSCHLIRCVVFASEGPRLISQGHIAKLAGYPRYSRHVGNALRDLPAGSTIPWFVSCRLVLYA